MSPGRALTAVLVLALGVAGCGLFGDDGDRILVIGDSVTQMATGDVEERFDDIGHVDMRAHFGDRTDQQVGPATEGAREDPDVAVVVIGYNDLLQGTVETDALGALVEALAEVPCTIWVLLPIDGGYPAADAERWNQRIQEAVADRPSMHVTSEWKDLVERSPESTFVYEDAVHPNAEGRRALAEVLRRAVGRDCV